MPALVIIAAYFVRLLFNLTVVQVCCLLNLATLILACFDSVRTFRIDDDLPALYLLHHSNTQLVECSLDVLRRPCWCLHEVESLAKCYIFAFVNCHFSIFAHVTLVADQQKVYVLMTVASGILYPVLHLGKRLSSRHIVDDQSSNCWPVITANQTLILFSACLH